MASIAEDLLVVGSNAASRGSLIRWSCHRDCAAVGALGR